MKPSDSTTGLYRLACERCRKQKLRCLWSSKEPGLACDRCVGADAHCETNTARRVGRPPRNRVRQGLSVPLAATSASLRLLTSTSSTQARVASLRPNQLQHQSAPLPGDDEDDDGSADSHLVERSRALTDADAALAQGQRHTQGHDDVFQFVGIFENGTSGESSLPATRPPTHMQESMSGRAEDWHLQLARLSAVLFKMPPNGNEKQTAQRGLWIMLVPQIVAHMKTLQSLISRAAPGDDTGTNLYAESLSVDGAGWLLQLSCFTRVMQICRLVLASLRGSLETNRDIIREMSFEDSMMRDDEPGLKVSVLVQILSSRINALAVALKLPEQHRVGYGASAPPTNTKPTPASSPSASLADWILRGNPAERMVFGSADGRRETIFEAFRAECEVLIALAS